MESMEAQLHNIVLVAGRFLLNPFVLTTMVVGTLAIVTGLAARVAILVEDLGASRKQRR